MPSSSAVVFGKPEPREKWFSVWRRVITPQHPRLCPQHRYQKHSLEQLRQILVDLAWTPCSDRQPLLQLHLLQPRLTLLPWHYALSSILLRKFSDPNKLSGVLSGGTPAFPCAH